MARFAYPNPHGHLRRTPDSPARLVKRRRDRRELWTLTRREKSTPRRGSGAPWRNTASCGK